MSDSKTLVRYLTVPPDIFVPSGVGLVTRRNNEVRDGGVLSFAEFLRRLTFARLPRDTVQQLDIEGTLLDKLSDVTGGAQVELPELAWAALCESLPKDLARDNFDLYVELRPFFRAVLGAANVQPEDWRKAA